ncbi:MAG: hypothetical protein ACRD6W_18675 [Nitrososphaerales archaeon]
MKLPRLSKKTFVAVGLATGLALGTAGVALAYVGAKGSGTGTASPAPGKQFKVTLYSGTGTTFAPGSPTHLTFTVQNVTTTTEHAATVTAKVVAKGLDIVTATGKVVTGCLASWFTVKLTRWEVASTGVYHSLTPGSKTYEPVTATLTPLRVIHVTVLESMITTTTTTQGVCEGHTPTVTLTVHK